MGVLLRQNDNRSQLQEKLAAELREKAKQQAAGSEPLDQASDSRYIKDTEVATRTSGLWALLVIVAIVAVIVLLIVW